MEMHNVTNYSQMSTFAANKVMQIINSKPNCLLCLATGSTPRRAYSLLADEYIKCADKFCKIRLIKLDEWVGVPFSSIASCEHYLRQNILEPLNISEDRYISFNNNTKTMQKECEGLNSALDNNGPIDLSILGIGVNGHIGLIEPAPVLEYHAHIAHLSKQTQSHSMLANENEKPNSGITLGIGDLFNSKEILLLVSGNNKREILMKMLKRKISTELPASILWLHPKATLVYDEETFCDK